MSANPVSYSPSPSPWLSKGDVVSLTGWTGRHINRIAAAGALRSRESQARSRNGRTHREFDPSSLPAEIQTRLQTPPRALVPAPPLPLFATLPAATVPASDRLRLADPREAAQADARMKAIEPLLRFRADPARFASLRTAAGEPVTSFGRLTQYLAEQHGVSGRTLMHWKSAFEQGGHTALARRRRVDAGQSRWFATHPKAAEIVAAEWLKPYASKKHAFRQLQSNCFRIGLDERDLPSYEAVRAFLETIPKPIAVLAREGERQHSERMSLYLKRMYTDVPANRIWVSDHMIHDVFVWNDCFPSEPEGRQMRLRLTMILDMRSRKPVGYSWTPEGSSGSIATALRRAVSAYGPCELFYCDNGKDFTKVAKGGGLIPRSASDNEALGVEIERIDRLGILARLGIPTQHCLKYHPQSKHIERSFRSLHGGFDAQFAAYTTGNAYNRPDAATALLAHHVKLVKAGLHSQSKLMPASRFIRMCASWLEEVYANAPHTGEGMAGLSPNQVFDAGYPLASRRAVDPARLEELFLECKKVGVRESMLTLHKRRYEPIDSLSSTRLYLANETDVLVHYDPNDLDSAIVTDLQGNRLASVRPERLVPHSAAAQPRIAESMAERRRHRNASAGTIRTLRRNVSLMGVQSDLQQTYERSEADSNLTLAELITQRAGHGLPGEPAQTKQTHSEDIGDQMAARVAARELRRRNGTHG